MAMLKYSVLLPARNEADRIGATIAALHARREVQSIVVIDDASTDDTASIAEAAGVTKLIRLVQRAGKGGALQFGLAEAPTDTDVFLFLDADLGDSATECVKLIEPIERDEADMTIGLLPPDPVLAASGSSGGGMGFVVGLARRGLRRKTGRQFQQPLSGQRAIRKSVIDAMSGKLPRGFGVEVGLTLAAVAAGFRVLEVDTAFRHRVTGDDFKANLHRAQQLIDVYAVLHK